MSAVSPAPGDLIVGFPNPNEVREISSELAVEGNIIVLNNGRLSIRNTTVRLSGNIQLLNNGKLEVIDGRLELRQDYLYHRSVALFNTSSLWLANSTLDMGGYNAGCLATDSAALRFDASSLASGVMTTTLRARAMVDAAGSQPLGEMLFFDSSRGSFNNCSLLLSWFVLPPASLLRGSLPGRIVNDAWVFPDAMRTASGIGARVRYENCVDLAWAMMTMQGCDAVIEDSDLLAMGAIFSGSGNSEISGLVNGVTHTSYPFPTVDRSVRLDRTRVGAWNLYTFGSGELTINNSVFGEVISFENSSVVVNNSICDGSGGYIGSMDDSRMQVVQSSVRAPVISRHRSQLLTILTTLQGNVAHAADNSVLALLHSGFTALPSVDAGAVAAVVGIDDPSQAPVNALVPVYGTVRFIPGADVPLSFVSFWLDGIRVEDPDAPFPVSPPSIRQRYRDTLCIWNTAGLLPGDHALRVHMRLSSGDTIVVPWAVRLTVNTTVEAVAVANGLRVSGPAPNPSRSGDAPLLTVHADDQRSSILLHIYDGAGRRVQQHVVSPGQSMRVNTNGWARGRYQVLAVQGGRSTGTALIVR
ncbi:MAG: hypothetical protein M5R41_08390 [Bacteroidia bacterium]|nr:hypothetical protein [Bacteroidia bacterium]